MHTAIILASSRRWRAGQSRIRTCILNFLDYARAAALPISYLSVAGSILPLNYHAVFLEHEPESNRHLFPFGRVFYTRRGTCRGV